MSLTANAKTYTPDSFQQNSVGYIGSLKTASAKDDIVLRRTSPKPNATYSGSGRTSAKMTRTLALTNAVTLTGDLIVEISVSSPVGAAGADIDSALTDMGAWIASSEGKAHVKTLKVSY